MRLANVANRATLVTDDSTLQATAGTDVATASNGQFGPSLAGIYEVWNEFQTWAETVEVATSEASPVDPLHLGPPTPEPRQIVAAGLNYGKHIDESGFDRPDELPPIFTKFVSSLSGPLTEVNLPAGGHTDWEIELGVIIGSRLSQVDEASAIRGIAGYTVTQDISERVLQLRGPAPQFSLGKSFPGFLPSGPWLTTLDVLPDKDDLTLDCEINGESVQHSTTKSMLFPVGALLAELSAVMTLFPGDLVLTGTPEGVGLGRTPERWLQPGDVLTSRITGLGELRQTFIAN
ncbi:fumarylacetoacetate hydrolase family protein [Nesterenkonia sphaerica]|uniref:Fumarylacetoacetate hydrolase family protein n=1 Tax=Nesterenkonia sphaerica TaxID=1804988 RepID=A0A5R9AP12_9MICC|nr:fumarylacetoacetate hydrolase family protein [Nesterenkonia sphaerica]TLP79873.1 fumarylacetoacetate hydrolase family protein [Nesterenkonia sphaerica]